MNDLPDNLIKAAKSVLLAPEEKSRIRGNLGRFILANPVRVAPVIRPWNILEVIYKYNYMTIAILLVVLLGGGVSAVAERALPGDALYSVKTGINENVRGAFAVGAEAEGHWQAELVTRRLEEASELSTEGKLDADVENELAKEVEEHATAAESNATSLRAAGRDSDAKGVEESLQTALSMHQEILSGAKADQSSPKAEEVRHKSTAIESVVERLQTKIGSEIHESDKVEESSVPEGSATGEVNIEENKESSVKPTSVNTEASTQTEVKTQVAPTAAPGSMPSSF